MPSKVEYPPLFPAGFHRMTPEELRRRCVEEFPLSQSRSNIMSGLEDIIEKLANWDVTGELWIDGSFVTNKIDPEDVDVLLRIDADLYDTGSQAQRDAIDGFGSSALKASHHCDSYVLREYPQGHALHNESEWDRVYWNKQFGFSRGKRLQGQSSR